MNKVTTQTILSIIIFIGGGLFLWKGGASDGINASIINLMMLCAGFWFGSSSGSAKKDELINTLANNQPIAPIPPVPPTEVVILEDETKKLDGEAK